MISKRIKFILGSVFKLFIITLGILACAGDSRDCGAIMKLLNPYENQVVIDLDFNKTKGELEMQIRTVASSSDMKTPVNFGLELNGKTYNSSIHAPHINQFACYGIPAMRHKSPQLEVIMNKNHIMIDGIHRLDIDSLDSFIEWYFPYDVPYGEKVVKLQCDESCSSEKIEKCIEAIGDGYINYYRKEAAARYQKNLCDLDSLEINTVSKKYPFELRLWLGDPAPVSIPPVVKPIAFSCFNL